MEGGFRRIREFRSKENWRIYKEEMNKADGDVENRSVKRDMKGVREPEELSSSLESTSDMKSAVLHMLWSVMNRDGIREGLTI